MAILSAKQIALFGATKVLWNKTQTQFPQYITLLDLYNAGWWVTERFGTIITLVKPRTYEKDGFACLCKKIKTEVNLDSLDYQIKLIANKKYNYYKNKLSEKNLTSKNKIL